MEEQKSGTTDQANSEDVSKAQKPESEAVLKDTKKPKSNKGRKRLIMEEIISARPMGVEFKQKKNSVSFIQNDRQATVIGSTILLNCLDARLGKTFKELTKEEAQKRHLGKSKSIGKVKSTEDAIGFLNIFFSSESK